MSCTIFQNGKSLFQAIKTRSLKTRKIDIFLKELTHGFGRKLAVFLNFFFGNVGQENVFCDILERRNAFLGYKKQKFKTFKNSIFSKGLTHGFGPKMAIFSTSSQAIKARKMSYSIFQNGKSLFQAIKLRSSKSRKIDIFPTGLTYCFGPKTAIFATFF